MNKLTFKEQELRDKHTKYTMELARERHDITKSADNRQWEYSAHIQHMLGALWSTAQFPLLLITFSHYYHFLMTSNAFDIAQI